MRTNVLYYGDNLDILRRYVPDASVDLVYLDPPFSSNRAYNVIFRDESGNQSDAQLVAFDDTWHWGPHAERTYAYLTNTAMNEGKVPNAVSTIVAALRAGLGSNLLTAYLVEMSVRLVELHRVLKPTGSLWLHCDPTASHYLKLVLDAIFGPTNFRNEVVWKRADAHNDAGQGMLRLGRVHDVLLFYTMSDDYTFTTVHTALPTETADKWYIHKDPDGRRWNYGDLTAAKPGGDTSYEINGVRPPKGRYWAYSKAKVDAMLAEGRIVYKKSGMPYIKRYLDESKGVPLQDVWTDVSMLRAWGGGKERLGYPTQKPLALLERIIEVSSNPGDVILDPFCGCGTAVVAAQRLGRQWVGIEITYLAIRVMRQRLHDAFPALDTVDVIGQPTEVQGVRDWLASLGKEGPYQFQWWATELVGATPYGGMKKGADQGVDGIITFTDHLGDLQSVIVSVKSGTVNSGMVQGLKGAMESHKAAMGLFVTLEEPTAPMKKEAAVAGVYHSELTGKDYQRLQILTIRELLEEHRKPDLPLMVLPAFQKAPKVAIDVDQQELFGG